MAEAQARQQEAEAAAPWSQGVLAIGAGSLRKQRLLYGALRLEPEEIRHEGAGQMLGRVIESSAVESLALSGGFLGLVAFIERRLAAMILAVGAGGMTHVLMLVGWLAVAAFIGRWVLRSRRRWTDTRLAMTNDLIERMVGHRTRLAQEPRAAWHEGEDQQTERYLEISSIRLERPCSYRHRNQPGAFGLLPVIEPDVGQQALGG